MNDALIVITFLALGYVLFAVEIIVPGGIIGSLGLMSVLYGCYLAFDLGAAWGVGSIVGSMLVFAVGLKIFFRSRLGRGMAVVSDDGAGDAAEWTSVPDDWRELVGAEGVATTDLRPAGLATIGGERVDVVSDNVFIDAGSPVRVVEVEGRRIVVEAVEATPPTI
ncbi:MAG: NfeD family protein [Acidobacteriota bacterium]